MQSVQVRVVGVTFQEGYPDNLLTLWEDLENGAEVHFELVREPENEHDPNAILVTADGRPVGHIPRQIAEVVAPEMDKTPGCLLISQGRVVISPNIPEKPGLEITLVTANQGEDT